nr:MAG TPA: hypothetical protein [Caudoviricetes sp.]
MRSIHFSFCFTLKIKHLSDRSATLSPFDYITNITLFFHIQKRKFL